MTFSIGTFQARLKSMPATEACLLGLSGGLDSVVLLHLLVQLRNQGALDSRLRALHVNHGLHPLAIQWQQHCAALCQKWGVPLQIVQLDLTAPLRTGSGIENAARNARYTAFSSQLGSKEVLLLAHHRDDQIETMLLRLMRGAGPRGLAGMPQGRVLGRGFLYRPLLQFDRAELLAYAGQQQLQWIEDPSNLAVLFDRNFCRQTILPLIETRWPGYRDSWSKSAALQSEADMLLQQLAEADFRGVRGATKNELCLDGFNRLNKPRQRNLLKYWLGQMQLPEPGFNELQHLTEALIPAAADSPASWHGAGFSIASYRNRLVVIRELAPIDRNSNLVWNPLRQPLLSLPQNGCLQARRSSGSVSDIRHALLVSGPLQVRYRMGGETLRLRDRPRKALKKILQEQGMPLWCRERLPLLYAGNELVCVPGVGTVDTSVSAPSAELLVIEWQQPHWAPVTR